MVSISVPNYSFERWLHFKSKICFSVFNEFWYFKPLYQEDPSSAAGLISRTLQFLRIKKVPLRKLIGGEKPLTLADIHERGNVREMACVIPVSVDILHVPTIMWYKDGVPVRLELSVLKATFVSLSSQETGKSHSVGRGNRINMGVYGGN